MLRFFVLLLPILSFYSCGSSPTKNYGTHKFPKKHSAHNLIPEFIVLENLTQNRGRTPASIKTPVHTPPERLPEKSQDTQQNDDGIGQYSNKRLYFLTLYSEYQALNKLYQHDIKMPDINICPSFHGAMINFPKDNVQSEYSSYENYAYDSKQFNDHDYLALHPELLLPMTPEASHPRVIDIGAGKETQKIQELVGVALRLHLTKTYNELNELCEFGESDNYYSYENLITHVQSKNNFSKDPHNIKLLMKTTLFSNLMLITALTQKETSGDFAHFSDEMAMRLGAYWVPDYFAEVKGLRLNYGGKN